jgi:hypothetical protein
VQNISEVAPANAVGTVGRTVDPIYPDPLCESTNSSGEIQVSLTCIPVNYYREYVTIVAEYVTIVAVCITIAAKCATTAADCTNSHMYCSTSRNRLRESR